MFCFVIVQKERNNNERTLLFLVMLTKPLNIISQTTFHEALIRSLQEISKQRKVRNLMFH